MPAFLKPMASLARDFLANLEHPGSAPSGEFDTNSWGSTVYDKSFSQVYLINPNPTPPAPRVPTSTTLTITGTALSSWAGRRC